MELQQAYKHLHSKTNSELSEEKEMLECVEKLFFEQLNYSGANIQSKK